MRVATSIIYDRRVYFVVLLICVFAMWNFFGPKPIQDIDAAVIGQLQEAGSDMSKEHKVDFSLYFPSQENAQTAAAEIIKIYPSFKTRILPSEGTEWLLDVSGDIVPNLSKMQTIRIDFDRIAATVHGEYDGWGALIVK